jgi:hypothetical protein
MLSRNGIGKITVLFELTNKREQNQNRVINEVSVKRNQVFHVPLSLRAKICTHKEKLSLFDGQAM